MSATIYRRRLPPIHLAGATYFLTFRLASLQLEPLTADERDLVVAHIVVMKPGELRALVVMPDRVHIAYESEPDESLVATLQAIKGVLAHRLVKLGRRHPPIWQGETYDHVVRTEQELLETWRYVEGNPVRRGLAETPEAYRWSNAWNRK
jgi:REP element-mobilizing transposase RayT